MTIFSTAVVTGTLNRAVGTLTPILVPMDVCPKAPPGAQQYADDITGYVLWGAIGLFVVGLVVSVGAIVAGRIFSMQHASKYGVVGLFVIMLAAVAYGVAPGIVDGILGNGCI